MHYIRLGSLCVLITALIVVLGCGYVSTEEDSTPEDSLDAFEDALCDLDFDSIYEKSSDDLVDAVIKEQRAEIEASENEFALKAMKAFYDEMSFEIKQIEEDSRPHTAQIDLRYKYPEVADMLDLFMVGLFEDSDFHKEDLSDRMLSVFSSALEQCDRSAGEKIVTMHLQGGVWKLNDTIVPDYLNPQNLHDQLASDQSLVEKTTSFLTTTDFDRQLTVDEFEKLLQLDAFTKEILIDKITKASLDLASFSKHQLNGTSLNTISHIGVNDELVSFFDDEKILSLLIDSKILEEDDVHWMFDGHEVASIESVKDAIDEDWNDALIADLSDAEVDQIDYFSGETGQIDPEYFDFVGDFEICPDNELAAFDLSHSGSCPMSLGVMGILDLSNQDVFITNISWGDEAVDKWWSPDGRLLGYKADTEEGHTWLYVDDVNARKNVFSLETQEVMDTLLENSLIPVQGMSYFDVRFRDGGELEFSTRPSRDEKKYRWVVNLDDDEDNDIALKSMSKQAICLSDQVADIDAVSLDISHLIHDAANSSAFGVGSISHAIVSDDLIPLKDAPHDLAGLQCLTEEDVSEFVWHNNGREIVEVRSIRDSLENQWHSALSSYLYESSEYENHIGDPDTEHLSYFDSVGFAELSPTNRRMTFALQSKDAGEYQISAIGIVDLDEKEVQFTNIAEGLVEPEISWSVGGRLMAYETIESFSRSRFNIDDVQNGETLASVSTQELNRVLEEKMDESFDPDESGISYGDVILDEDGSMVYFQTLAVTPDVSEDLQSLGWAMDLDDDDPIKTLHLTGD